MLFYFFDTWLKPIFLLFVVVILLILALAINMDLLYLVN